MNVHSLSSTTTMPTLTSQRRATSSRNGTSGDKREAISKAAVKVFAQRGFFNAQVADVARAAGVAAGTVYLYFRSKDEILTSIFERTMKDGIAEGRAALEGVTDPVERLRSLARMHLRRLGRDRDLAVVFQVELRQSTKFMEQLLVLSAPDLSRPASRCGGRRPASGAVHDEGEADAGREGTVWST